MATLDPTKYSASGAVLDPYNKANLSNASPVKRYNAGGGVIDPYGTPKVGDVSPVVAAPALGTTPALTVPPTTPQTGSAGTNEFITSLNTEQKTAGQTAMDQQFELDKAKAGKSATDLELALGKQGTEGAKQEEIYKQLGIDTVANSVIETQNRIDATERARVKQIEQLEKNTQGLFGGALQDEINRVNRDFSRQQADDSITLNALTRNFTNMTAIAERQLKEYMDPIDANVEFQKELFKTNESNFTQTQRDALSYKIAQDDKKRDKIEAEAKAISDAKIEALKSASEQGASPEIIRAIQAAKTTEDVAKAAGLYGGDLLKRELLMQQIKTEKAQRANINSQISARTAESSGAAAKPATAAQFTAGGYASRTVQAESVLQKNKEAIASFGAARYAAARNLPNSMQPPVVQEQLQAERNFINAVLRRESGAAISPEEFQSASKQYFPQPGDSPGVLVNKEQNRALVQQNLIRESGSAYVPPINEFQQALGVTTEKIPGTNIIQSTGADGSINFALPK